MHRLIPYVLLIHLVPFVQGQVIRGLVYDRESGSPVELADIYLDGTFTGTTSDSGGLFAIDISRYPARALTVSSIGYYSQSCGPVNPDSLHFFGLIPRRYDLEGATVSAGSLVSEQFERRRRRTYRGSSLHFFRALWKNHLDQTPFTVRNNQHAQIGYSAMVQEDTEGIKYLTFPEPLEVSYFTNWSLLEFIHPSVRFDSTGYFDPRAIRWRGKMGTLRVGDWLPFDYQSE